MVWLFSRGANRDDFSAYLNDAETSKKKELIAECQRRGVTIFIDNPSESSAGIYAKLRAVASEPELERRLQSARAMNSAQRANFIAWLALATALAALLKDILCP